MQLQNVLYFLLFAGLFFVMMRFGCGAHISGHGHHHHGEGDDERGMDSNPSNRAPEQVKDPVCGMMVATATAKTAVHAGQTYYFCSSDCRDKFEASPSSYSAPASESHSERKAHHGCC